jgi:hypothetical protein
VTAAKLALSPPSLAPAWRDELPQDDFERQLFRKASDLEKQGVPQGEVQDCFDKERAARRRRDTIVEEKQCPRPIPPPPGTVRINRRDRKCLVDEYKKLLNVCDGASHHIVPDMVYRLGARPKGAGMSSTADRIPNAPTLNEGMAICLSKAQHGSGLDGIHADLRKSLNDLGADYTPSGTAPHGEIISAAKLSMGNIEDISEKCKDLAKSKLSFQIGQKGFDS